MGFARTRDRTGAPFTRDEDQTADVIDLELCELDDHGGFFRSVKFTLERSKA